MEQLDAREGWLAHHLADALVQAAIGHALPNLGEALDRAEVTTKAEESSTYAVARSAGRATPFGLLGTWTLGSVGPRTELALGGRDELDLHVRTPLAEVRAGLEGTVRDLVVSPFLHTDGETWRLVDGPATTTVTPDPYVRAVLALLAEHGHLPRADLHAAVSGLGVSGAGAERYVDQLVDVGVLVPRPALSPVAPPPTEVRRWRAEDRPDPTLSVDTVRAGTVVLGPELVAEVARGLDLLRRVTPVGIAPELVTFAAAFERRFGDATVPLLVALDPERGVGVRPSSAPSELPVPDRLVEHRRTWAERDDVLRHLVAGAVDGEVRLTERDVGDLEHDPPTGLPATGSAMLTLGPGSTLWWRTFFGPGSAAPFARMAAGWPALATELVDQVRLGDALSPHPVVELVDLTGGRLVDIVLRPDLGRRELVVDARPAAPDPLTPRDLSITVEHGRVVLLGPDGAPVDVRHSTLWNTNKSTSDLVHLLMLAVDPTGHGTRMWSWGALESTTTWTPRVRHGRSVLSPQTWRITSDVLEQLKRDGSIDGVRETHGWPALLSFGEPGTNLVLNLDEPTQARAAHTLLTRGRTRQVQEVPQSPVTSPEGHHLHDLVIGIVDERPRRPVPVPLSKTVRHTPGSTWVSTTWEATPAAVDRILREHVPALVEEVAAPQWFFLRYADPHHHLRLRFKTSLDALPLIHAAHARAHDLTRLLTVDTYVPEERRYPDVGRAEAAFHADSAAVLAVLPGLPPADRWRTALVGAHHLLRVLPEGTLEAWAAGTSMKGSHEAAGRAFRTERHALLDELQADDRWAERDDAIAALQITDLATATSLVHLHVNRLLVDRHRQHESVISDLLLRLRRVPRS